MNTTDPQTPDQTPDPTPPTNRGSKKKPSWGFEVFLIFPLIALLNLAASPLFSLALSDRLPAVLEFVEPASITLEGTEVAVEGLTTLAVPADDLSAWAIGQFIVAKAIWILGLFIAMWFAARVVSEVVKGRPFSTRASKGLGGLSWTLVITGPLYALAQVPGDNLVIRDLGLRGFDVSNSVTSNMTYLWIGAVFLAELLRRAVRRGREVQDELEGVI